MNSKHSSEPSEDIDDLVKEELKEAVEFWKSRNVTPEVTSDGHFRGWVQVDVARRCGIALDPRQFWEQNSSLYHQLKKAPTKAKGYSSGRARGWSDAKSLSATMLTINPNQYFYRHCEPGVEQWTGEWTKEEYDLFMSVAKKFGSGDKWGIFSSYIPHRVGYQCANFYRNVLLSEGKITDPNYRIGANSKAIYVGVRQPSGDYPTLEEIEAMEAAAAAKEVADPQRQDS